MGLLAELRRRHVFRVAGLYLVVAWLLLQAANILEGSLGLPGWFDAFVTALLLLGLPLALVLAWAFELTPEGVQRTAPAEGEAPRSRPLDVVLVVALLGVAGLIFTQGAGMFFARAITGPRSEARKGPAGAKVEASVAVLPFVDLSPEQDQGYFSDGLAEEILNVLARDTDLGVAGRTSSFAFRGKGVDLREIAKTLAVTHVLEGSVRKSGRRIRVTAQLVRADTGFHAFSETYDRELAEVFSVQDDIARRIASALTVKLRGGERGRTKTIGIEAYELFLAARDAVHDRTKAQLEKAEVLLDRALELAPEHAPSHALRGLVSVLLAEAVGTYGTRPAEEAFAAARGRIARALELDPDLADAHAVMGLITLTTPGDDGDPLVHLDRALALNPRHVNAQLWRANAGPNDLKRYERLRRLWERDPGFWPPVGALVGHHLKRGETERARAVLDRTAAVPGLADRVSPLRALTAYGASELADAYRILEPSVKARPRNREVRLMWASILLDLGELDRAEAVGGPDHRVRARLARGDVEAALELAKAHETNPKYLGTVMNLYLHLGRVAEAVRVFEGVYGKIGQDDSISRFDFSGWLLATAAYAYRSMEMDAEADRALNLFHDALKSMDRLGYTASIEGRFLEVTRLALDGEKAAAVKALRALVADGAATAMTTDYWPAELLPEPAMYDVERGMWANVDAERARLGLPPFPKPSRPLKPRKARR